jgi:Fic family protein
MNVRTKNDLKQWFKFFLVGVIATAKKGISTFDAILKLKKEIEESVQQVGKRSTSILKILDYLYQKPILDSQKAAKITQVSVSTSYKIIDDMVALGILKEITGGKRGKIYTFDKYIKLFQ